MQGKVQTGLAAGAVLLAGTLATAQVIDGGQVNRSYSGLYAYYDAGEGVDVDGSTGIVLTWYNLALTGPDPMLRDLWRIIGTPYQIAGAINGLPAIEYDGISGTWAAQVDFGEVHQPCTYFVVARIDVACPEFSGYLFDSSTSASRIALLYSQAANPCNWTLYAGSTVDSSVPVAEGEYQIHTIVADGANSAHYINGQLAYTGDIGVGYMWGLILGMRYSASSGLEGQIAEFAVYDELLGDTDRGAVEQYLSDKFAIPLGDDCPPDVNGDGVVNSQDFIMFLNAFVAGDPLADWNNDGNINSQDFVAFLNDFVQGC